VRRSIPASRRGEDLAVRALRLWISFYPFSQDDYLAAVGVWLAHFGVAPARSARDACGARTRGHPVRAAARLALRSRGVAVREGLRRCAGARRAPGAATQGQTRNADDRHHARRGRGGRAAGRPGAACAAPRGKAYAGYWGVPGRQARARRDPGPRARSRVRESSGSWCGARRLGSCRSRLSARARRAQLLRVYEWDGQPHGHDGQAFAWQMPGAFDVAPLLPANTRIMQALLLPPVYGITAPPTSARRPSRARRHARSTPV